GRDNREQFRIRAAWEPGGAVAPTAGAPATPPGGVPAPPPGIVVPAPPTPGAPPATPPQPPRPAMTPPPPGTRPTCDRCAGHRRFGIAEARQGHGCRGQDGHSQRADPSARGARRPARDSGGDRRFGGNPSARGPARPRRRRAKVIDRKGLAGKSSERQPAEGAVGDADGIGLHSAARQSKDMIPRTLAAVALLVLYIGRQFVAPTSLPVGGRRAAAPTASAAAIETARSPASAYNVVASRNLFSPTRTEAPSSGVIAVTPVVRPNLFGVV